MYGCSQNGPAMGWGTSHNFGTAQRCSRNCPAPDWGASCDGGMAQATCGAEPGYLPDIPARNARDTGRRGSLYAHRGGTGKEGTMSLAGIIKTIHGVAVFGDSKSSVYENGVLKPNPGQPYVKKVFRGNGYIVSTSGVNQVFLKSRCCSLENALETEILHDPAVTPVSFAERVQELFFHVRLEEDTWFHVGYALGGRYEAYSLRLAKDGHMDIEGMANDFGAKWSGAGNYVPPHFSAKRDMDMPAVSEFIRAYMGHVIAIGDLMLDYNPIGGEICIETIS